MSEKATPDGQHGEEDLLADFRDVLGEGEDEGGTSPTPADETTDLEALDAFLNEFGQGEAAAKSDPGEAVEDDTAVAAPSDPLLDDVAELVAAEPLDAPEPDIVAVADEVPELNVAAALAPDDLDLGGVEEMLAPEPPQRSAAYGGSGDLFAAPPPPPTPAVAPVSIMAAEDEPPVETKTLDVSTIGVALFSLVIAAVAGWFALSLHGQMNDLRAELTQLRQQPAGVPAGPDRQTQENLARLTQRVNEMAVLLEGPMSHLSDSGVQLNTVNVRLEELEQRIGGLRDELMARAAQPAAKAAAKPAVASPAPKPAASPAPKPARAPVTAASQPAASGGWVVNVASLTDAKAAAAERQRLQQAGFNVEVQTAQMEGRTWHRVRATGFTSREQAQVYSDMIRHKMGVTPWVGMDK
jgi:cell division protein FtsN